MYNSNEVLKLQAKAPDKYLYSELEYSFTFCLLWNLNITFFGILFMRNF
jgi:hypothetical protein